MRVLDLFSGEHSVGKVASALGYEVVSLDLSDATICCNILQWDYNAVNLPPPLFGHGRAHHPLKLPGSRWTAVRRAQHRVCPTPTLVSNEHKPRCLWMVNRLPCAQQRAWCEGFRWMFAGSTEHGA